MTIDFMFQTPYGGGGLLNAINAIPTIAVTVFQTPYGGGGLLNWLLEKRTL